jgi:predicted nucleic acid-binding protein
MPDKNLSAKIAFWLESEIIPLFLGRTLPVNARMTDIWGRIRAKGRTLPAVDSLLAASAIACGLTFVTRNTKDFIGIDGLDVFNPWKYDDEQAN